MEEKRREEKGPEASFRLTLKADEWLEWFLFLSGIQRQLVFEISSIFQVAQSASKVLALKLHPAFSFFLFLFLFLLVQSKLVAEEEESLDI